MSAPASAALVALQRSRNAPADLFVNLFQRQPDPSVTWLDSTGYSQIGRGAARYVADVLADAALRAAHPRFVVQTANGRFFRLLPESGKIGVEQGGALGDGTSNDQPAIQATIDYAEKVGAAEVRFERAHYRLHCPIRTAPASDKRAEDGHPLVVRHSLALRGCAAERTVLDFRGLDGDDPATSWQTVARSAADPTPVVWRGGGLLVQGDISDSAPAARRIARLELDRLVLRGNRPRTGAAFWPADPETGDGWDITDKALWLQDCYAGAILCRDVDMIGWRGEIFYLGGAVTAVESVHLERCRFNTTNGSALNPGVNCALVAIDCAFGNASQAQEDTGKSRAIYRNCTWYDCPATALGGGPTAAPAYNFVYPTRSTDEAMPGTVLEGCVFRNIDYFTVYSWVRGRITTIDTEILLSGSQGMALKDVDLEVDAWIDRRGGYQAITFYGLASLSE